MGLLRSWIALGPGPAGPSASLLWLGAWQTGHLEFGQYQPAEEAEVKVHRTLALRLTHGLPGESSSLGQKNWDKPLAATFPYCAGQYRPPFPPFCPRNSEQVPCDPNNQAAALMIWCLWFPLCGMGRSALQPCLRSSLTFQVELTFSVFSAPGTCVSLLFHSWHDLIVIGFPVCFLHQAGAFSGAGTPVPY